MTEQTERETRLLEALWEELPRQASTVLGVEVDLSKMIVESDVGDYSKRHYVATLCTEKPQPVDMFLVFDDRSAIAYAGLLVMMQEKVINEKMSRRDLDADDLDAMNECVNQIGSAINKVIHDHLGSEYHVVVRNGGLQEPEELERYKKGRIIVARAKMQIGSLHSGEFAILIPESLFTGVSVEESGGDAGVSLSPEEAAALRQVTLDGMSREEGIAVFLPIEREANYWEKTIVDAGIVIKICQSLHEARGLCRDSIVQMVLIDADACDRGGLPALAQLLAWPDVKVPILVAASRPTRTHLIACLAAGAATYLVKPVEVELFRARVQELFALWKEPR